MISDKYKMKEQIEDFLREKGADIVRFVDISKLPRNQTQGFTKAVVFCMALSKEFILAIHNGKETERDEFVDKEHETGALADQLAAHIRKHGYRAFSQSDESLIKSGYYDEIYHITKLPHKTIARLSGIGYVGKNNLLITEEFGCAFSMCTVLTDAPFSIEKYIESTLKCGDCDVCVKSCPENAIVGNEWSVAIGREGIIDVSRCFCAMKCMVDCPKTLNYALG